MLLLVNFDEKIKRLEEIRKKRYRANRLGNDSANLRNYLKRGLLCDFDERTKFFDVLLDNQTHLNLSFLGLVWVRIIGLLRDDSKFSLPLNVVKTLTDEVVKFNDSLVNNFESLVERAIDREESKIVIEFDYDEIRVIPNLENYITNHTVTISVNSTIRDYILDLEIVNNREHFEELGLFGILSEPELIFYFRFCDKQIEKFSYVDRNDFKIDVETDDKKQILNIILENKYKQLTYLTTDSEVTFKNKLLYGVS